MGLAVEWAVLKVQALLDAPARRFWHDEVVRIDRLMRALVRLHDERWGEFMVDAGVWERFPRPGPQLDVFERRVALFEHLVTQRKRTWKEAQQNASTNDDSPACSTADAGAGEF